MAVSNKQLTAMRKAGYSDEEIQQMLADDKRVDRGEVLEWDMSTEEHKKAMKYANVTDKTPKKSAETPKRGKPPTISTLPHGNARKIPQKPTLLLFWQQFCAKMVIFVLKMWKSLTKNGKLPLLLVKMRLN